MGAGPDEPPVNRVVLLAHGLSQSMTGIERLVVEHATWLCTAGCEVLVTCDAEASWVGELPEVACVLRLPRRTGQLLRRVSVDVTNDADLVHSFGPRLPRRSRYAIYSIYDWGPLRDDQMHVRSRVLWCAAMWSGIRSAELLHTISERTLHSAPHWVKGPWVVTRPGGLAVLAGPNGVQREDLLLFVGTDSPRKRLDVLTAAAEEAQVRLVLVGDGTHRYQGSHVIGLGRVEESELRSWYARCRGLVLVSSYEGFGIPVQEALDRGVPVLVSEAVLACHRDADPALALVVREPLSVASLAAELRRLLRVQAKQPQESEPGDLGHLYGRLST